MKHEHHPHSYLHCGRCIREKPDDQSPEEWARLSVAATDTGLLVRCVRHDAEVAHFELKTPLDEQCAACGDHTH